MQGLTSFRNLTLVVFLFLATLFIANIPKEISAYTLHNPIYINGNVNFTSANGVTNGSGTPSDPYIIEGWEINVTGGNGIEILDTDAHFTIRDVYIHGGWFPGVRYFNVSHGGIENSTIIKAGVGVFQESSTWCNVTGNYFEAEYPIQVGGGGSNLTFHGNIMNLPGYSIGAGIFIFAGGTADVIVTNNTIGTGGRGISAYDIRESVISGNILNGSEDNVVLRNPQEVEVFDNVVRGGWVGIITTGGRDSVYYSNVIENNHYGLHFQDGSVNHVIRYNRLQDNTYGVFIRNTGPNLIYHNDFIDSAGYDGPGTNTWDNGYPTGGNYWSVFSGVDNCSGPNQDICPDPDGLSDIPYNFNAGYWDNYPLMFPMELGFLRPPASLSANLGGEGFENVTLTWNLSLDDGMGLRSVVGYEIYRNTTYELDGVGYQLMASPLNGTSEFTDVSVGEGDPNNYFYRICAVDLNGNTSCAENHVGKFTRSLNGGPNLVSIPLIQSDESVEKVLQTVEFDKTWVYDSFGERWKSYVTFKPYKGELRSVNEAQGFWVNVTGDCNFTVAGIVPIQTTIHLSRGWNLVGYPSFREDYSVADFEADVITERVEGFEAVVPPYFLRLMLDGEILRTGYGYWVKVADEATWIVASS